MTEEATFSSLGVPTKIAAVLAREDKLHPFPIQKDTLPDTLQGRDVLGRGKTGSGKTLAFSIPMVARLGENRPNQRIQPRKPRGLVLAPTRELATQIDRTLAPLAEAYGMKTTTIFGGVSPRQQIAALKDGVDVVIACPGRLEDLIKQRELSLDGVEITVLDEADHMADLGFLPGVTRLLGQTPQRGQRLFFSATLDNGVDALVKKFLHNEILHSVDEATSHVSLMTHHVFEVSNDDKKTLVQKLASGRGKRILFTRTKYQAKKLAKQLTTQGIPAVDLHGNLSQNQRDRNLAAFGDGEVRVLVATDVAARGVHVDSVKLVVHVDPPAEHKAYLHRSGRTARAGTSGDVVTVMLPEQRKDTQILLKKAAISTTPVAVNPDSLEVNELVGEIATYVKPKPQQQQTRGRGQKSGARGGSRPGARGQNPRNGGSRSGSSKSSDASGSRGGSSRSGSSRGGSSQGGSSRGGSTRNTTAGSRSHSTRSASSSRSTSGGGRGRAGARGSR